MMTLSLKSWVRFSTESISKIVFGILLLLWATPAWSSLKVEVRSTKGKKLKGAVVYAIPKSGSVKPGNITRVINQKGETYLPRVQAIQRGDSLIIKNGDAVKHHSYSFSPAKMFNTPLQEKGELEPMKMDKVGEVIIGCNIHDWMASFVLVVDTPYFKVTEKSGEVQFDDLPKGSYTVKAYHPGARNKDLNAYSQDVDYQGDSSLEFKISVKKKGL